MYCKRWESDALLSAVQLSPQLFLYTSRHYLHFFYHTIHHLLPFFFSFLSSKNISSIGKLYNKEGVAWMYVYMRNYMKILKDELLKQKKTRRVNFRMSFVEILCYKGAIEGVASIQPTKTWLQSQPTDCWTLHFYLIYILFNNELSIIQLRCTYKWDLLTSIFWHSQLKSEGRV